MVLAIGVMLFAGAAGDWTKLANINDPLPQAMKMIVGESSGWLHMLVWLRGLLLHHQCQRWLLLHWRLLSVGDVLLSMLNPGLQLL